MDEVNKYIEKHYQNWLDYSEYYCGLAGIKGQEIDVLNEVLLSLLKKDVNKLESLLNAKKGGYTELDYYVLRMIKLNIYSPTSPYQNKYKPIPVAEGVEFSKLRIEDLEEESEDKPAELLSKIHKVREVFENLYISDKARKIFKHHFFLSKPLSEWSGEESLSELYSIYGKVVGMIRTKLQGESLF